MRAARFDLVLKAVVVVVLGVVSLPSSSAEAETPSARARPAAARRAAAPVTDAVTQRNSDAAPAAGTQPASASRPAPQKSNPSQKARAAKNTKRTAAPATIDVEIEDRGERKPETVAREREQRIRELLLLARRAAADGKLIGTGADNAAAIYRAVLALDPSQTEAVAGAQRIAAVLAKEVESAVAAGDQARADQYIEVIRSLQPDAATLSQLQARARVLDASPVVLSERQQDRYGLSAQSIDRAWSYLDNQPLNLRTLDQALDEYDRAAALVPDAPGLPLLKDRITVLFPEATRRELADEKSKRALKLVETARRRGWTTAELDPLEAEVKATMRPGRYDTTFAECPDSVAQACAQAPRQ